MKVQPGSGRPAKQVLAACLEAAIAAPSILNTQPWRFRVHETGIDVLVDRRRQLRAADPAGRELLISVGAALLNLRIAMLDHGWHPIVRRPAGGDCDLVATVGFGPTAAPDATVRALAAAIPRRRTNRRPYADVAVPAAVLEDLRAAAAAEGAVVSLAHPVIRDAILGLTRVAEEQLQADEAYRAELAHWVHAGSGQGDGVPPAVLGPSDAAGVLPLRDFGAALADRPPATVSFSGSPDPVPDGAPEDPPASGGTRVARFEAHPKLLILSTRGDGPAQWLAAGQALQRVLLTATVRELATQPMTQPLEVARIRDMMTDTAHGLYPQMVLRAGYGRPVPGSPRRPLQHVLVPYGGQVPRPRG